MMPDKTIMGWARWAYHSWHYFNNETYSVCKRCSHPHEIFKPTDESPAPYINDACGWCKKVLDETIVKTLQTKPPLTIRDKFANADITYNYDLLLKLTRDIPYGLELGEKKEVIPKELRETVEKRDNCTCQLCHLKDTYGNPGWDIPGKLAIHHIIPNGLAVEENLITLCKNCHNVVHLLLYITKKWRYVPMR